MNNINDTYGLVSSCTSCQMCSAVCPVEAISVQLDENGFYRPFLNEELCISCGKCKKVCYKFDDHIKMSDEHQKIYACKSKDEKILNSVTSGGVAYLLAELAVKRGYKVVGVSYNTQLDIAETEIDDSDIEKFKGSKYIQAYTEKAFKEIVKNLEIEKYVVFGTPCHIYALDKYAKLVGKRDNLILVDLFCHGCPSRLLWTKYIEKIKREMNVSKFDKVEFRSKKRGWHEFCLYFQSREKSKIDKNEFGYFYRLFFENILLNETCMDCKLRSTLAYTDIRIGDFWGHCYGTDKKGVSAVAVVSDIGNEWVSSLPTEIFICEHSLRDVTVAQSYGKIYLINEKQREVVFELLKSNEPIEAVLKKCTSFLALKAKVKLSIKRIYLFLPISLRGYIKNLLYVMKKD